jgi:hypothetical protein
MFVRLVKDIKEGLEMGDGDISGGEVARREMAVARIRDGEDDEGNRLKCEMS